MKERKLHALMCATGLTLVLVGGGGCTTKAKARADVHKAYEAGQQQGLRAAAERQNIVSFTGPVANPQVPWSEGLTLAQGILAAHWQAETAPSLIILKRGLERNVIATAQLLAGSDLPLQPGDIVELVP